MSNKKINNYMITLTYTLDESLKLQTVYYRCKGLFSLDMFICDFNKKYPKCNDIALLCRGDITTEEYYHNIKYAI